MSFNQGVYIYQETLDDESKLRIPDMFVIKEGMTEEALLLRLLLGTVNIEACFTEYSFEQRQNFINLGSIEENESVETETILGLDYVDVSEGTIVNKYFANNRRNSEVYKQLLCEFTNYFYQTQRESYTSAFIHLYRSVEYLSYPFPLIFASKTQNYKNSFEALKGFFKSADGELAFFKTFSNTLIDNEILNSKLSFDLINTNYITEHKRIIQTIYKLAIKERDQNLTEESGILTIPYRHFWDFIITLRNRFFHLKNGGQQNIEIININPDSFFESVNPIIVNWLAYIFYEMYKFGVENTEV